MVAVSIDDRETQARFKASLKAPYHFVADDKGALIKKFDVKAFLLNWAKRVTFVVGPGLEVLGVFEGSDAMDPGGAVKACSLKPPDALRYVLPPKDGGAP